MTGNTAPSPAPPPTGWAARWPLVSDYLHLVGSRYLGILVGAIRGFVIPSLLDPAAYGTYKSFLLIPPYVRAGHLGAVSGLSRQIPHFRGTREPDQLSLAVRVAYTFSIGSALLACVVLGLFAFSLDSATTRVALLVFLVFVVSEQQIAFRETYVIGHERFATAAKLRLVQNVVTAALAIGGAWVGGLLGLIVGTSLAGLISFTFYRVASGVGFPGFSLHRETTKELLSIGMPLLITGLLYNVFFTVDRLVIVRLLGAESMGFYSLGVTLVGYANDLTTLFSRIIFPRMVKRLAEGASTDAIRRYVHYPMAGAAYLFPFLVIAVHYFGIWLFRWVFPAYLPGAAVLEILCFGILLYAQFLLYMNLVVATKRQLGMIWIYPVAIVTTFVTAYGAVRMGGDIDGVAIATVAGFVVLSFLQVLYVERSILHNLDVPRRLLRSFGPTLYLIALVLVDHRLWGEIAEATVRGQLLRASAVALLYLPVPLWAWKNDPEFAGIFGMISRGRDAL